jgi:hypothetical protein
VISDIEKMVRPMKLQGARTQWVPRSARKLKPCVR